MFNTLRRNVQRLEQLVAKVIEEPVAGTSSTELINEVSAKAKGLTVALKTVHACLRRLFHGRSASSKSIA